MSDTLASRQKEYELIVETILAKHLPKIIRIDGKCFSQYLSSAEQPFDSTVLLSMIAAASELMKHIGGTARFAYIQSDECSIVLNDNLHETCQSWLGSRVQKVTSIAASIFTAGFNASYRKLKNDPDLPAGYFDCRYFSVPNLTEVLNNMLWRQQDALRNGVNKYARHYFSAKELHGVSIAQTVEKLRERGVILEMTPMWTLRGVVLPSSNSVDFQIPLFHARTDESYLTNLYNVASVGLIEEENGTPNRGERPSTNPSGEIPDTISEQA